MKQPLPDLVNFIEKEIIPLYAQFDAAHRESHVRKVIENSLALGQDGDTDINMVYAIAAYHDLGLRNGRELHHKASASIILRDKRLEKWFSTDQLTIMAEAAEDHRASSRHEPRSIYGKIIAEADRYIDPTEIIRRTVQYSLSNYPQFQFEEHKERCFQHLHEKYGEGGYLRLWMPKSSNAQRLKQLRHIIETPAELEKTFRHIYMDETTTVTPPCVMQPKTI